MATGNQGWAYALATTHTTEVYPRGRTREELHSDVVADTSVLFTGTTAAATSTATVTPRGDRTWVFAFNEGTNDATAWARGHAIRHDTGNAPVTWTGIRTTAAVAAGFVIGLAQHAVAELSYGFVGRRGMFYARTTAATIAVGAAVVTAASGRVITIGANDGSFSIGATMNRCRGGADELVLIDLILP